MQSSRSRTSHAKYEQHNEDNTEIVSAEEELKNLVPDAGEACAPHG